MLRNNVATEEARSILADFRLGVDNLLGIIAKLEVLQKRNKELEDRVIDIKKQNEGLQNNLQQTLNDFDRSEQQMKKFKERVVQLEVIVADQEAFINDCQGLIDETDKKLERAEKAGFQKGLQVAQKQLADLLSNSNGDLLNTKSSNSDDIDLANDVDLEEEGEYKELNEQNQNTVPQENQEETKQTHLMVAGLELPIYSEAFGRPIEYDEKLFIKTFKKMSPGNRRKVLRNIKLLVERGSQAITSSKHPKGAPLTNGKDCFVCMMGQVFFCYNIEEDIVSIERVDFLA